MEHAAHGGNHGAGDSFVARVTVATAILSTLGALGGYEAGHTQNVAMLYKNEAAIQKTAASNIGPRLSVGESCLAVFLSSALGVRYVPPSSSRRRLATKTITPGAPSRNNLPPHCSIKRIGLCA